MQAATVSPRDRGFAIMDAAPQFSRTQKIRNYFAWLDQVLADKTLPDTDFKVAYVIGQHVNASLGVAWPSAMRIAEVASVDKATVLRSVDRLQKAGHIAVEPGKQGRGHANRYRLILKGAPAHLFEDGKGAVDDLKGAFGGSKRCAGAPEPIEPINNLEETRACARASGLREKISNLKGWEAKQINKLLDRVEREQNKPKPNETIYEKVERLQRIADNSGGSITAQLNLNIAWLEAQEAGLAFVPSSEDALFNNAKPYWLNSGGPIIDHETNWRPLAGPLTMGSSS
jgi:hypothetical protein